MIGSENVNTKANNFSKVNLENLIFGDFCKSKNVDMLFFSIFWWWLIRECYIWFHINSNLMVILFSSPQKHFADHN